MKTMAKKKSFLFNLMYYKRSVGYINVVLGSE